jgi:hypothetical protein
MVIGYEWIRRRDINSAYIIQCGKLWIRIPDPVSGEKYLINNHE